MVASYAEMTTELSHRWLKMRSFKRNQYVEFAEKNGWYTSRFGEESLILVISRILYNRCDLYSKE